MVLVLIMVALVVSAVIAQARHAASTDERVLGRPRLEKRLRRLPPRPLPDQPPAGLAPLYDSPRVVASETARGIREIEQWLAGRASA